MQPVCLHRERLLLTVSPYTNQMMNATLRLYILNQTVHTVSISAFHVKIKCNQCAYKFLNRKCLAYHKQRLMQKL